MLQGQTSNSSIKLIEEESSTPHASSNQVDASPQQVGVSIDVSPIDVKVEES